MLSEFGSSSFLNRIFTFHVLLIKNVSPIRQNTIFSVCNEAESIDELSRVKMGRAICRQADGEDKSGSSADTNVKEANFA